MLINVSRGGLIDSAALFDALESGQIGALGLVGMRGVRAGVGAWVRGWPLPLGPYIALAPEPDSGAQTYTQHTRLAALWDQGAYRCGCRPLCDRPNPIHDGFVNSCSAGALPARGLTPLPLCTRLYSLDLHRTCMRMRAGCSLWTTQSSTPPCACRSGTANSARCSATLRCVYHTPCGVAWAAWCGL